MTPNYYNPTNGNEVPDDPPVPVIQMFYWFITYSCDINEDQRAILKCRLGNLLIEQRENLPHGKWISWMTENLPFGPDTAREYMRLARWGEHPFRLPYDQ